MSMLMDGGEAGKTKEGGQSQRKEGGKASGWAPEIKPKHRNSYQMEDNKAAPSAPPQGGGASRRPLGVLVVFHLVMISYAFGPFPGSIFDRIC